MTNWHIGTIGFGYKPWANTFYPPGLAPRQYLGYYSQRFTTVEIDTTFYGIPRPEQLARWSAVTPHNFTFTLKTPRSITHDHRLDDAAQAEMAQFTTVCQRLGPKLGPILIQLPPDFTQVEAPTLARFLRTLPDDINFALEFRHPSWQLPATRRLLERFNIAWVAADYIHMPKTIIPTADFIYLRLLGQHGRFPLKNSEQLDPTPTLQKWYAMLQKQLNTTPDIYIFANNDFAGYSPRTCTRLQEIIGLPPADIRILQQGRLF
ncbi:MAG TPA: DUF72 domain-containing protein [Anaerolineae bacterium]|nr:DUF72 domain-containing protein [Anaerolineae bacterium]